MDSQYYHDGRLAALSGRTPCPPSYSSRNYQPYNDYMNGYNSVSKSERRSRKDLLKCLDEFKKNERRKV